MRSIAEIVSHIKEEVRDAEQYALDATKYKDSDMETAEVYASLADQELKHIDMLHNRATAMIRKARDGGVEVPAAMQAVWDFEHEAMVEDVTRVKMILEHFKK